MEKNYVFAVLAILVVATTDAVGSLLGFWFAPETAGNKMWVIKGLLLLALVLLSFSVKRWVYQQTSDGFYRKVAWLSLLSLLVCLGGDITNANFSETFYRYDGVVKHDYLADSVMFFGPGYLLLLINGALVTRRNGIKPTVIGQFILAGVLAGALSIFIMHIPGTGVFVKTMTSIYAALIGAVGLLGILLIHSFGGIRASKGVWMVGFGFMLAAIADAVIGHFWIYGNGGQGYYPDVRHVNWILYAASQAMVIYLPFVLVSHEKGKTA
ncbi:hypothetical protein A8L45_04185 [Veronia pacifica]|uniref:Uncharacterized protein n=1 Tax=Veronia pacifica TaxID=1080227 RepID=A0A1C3EQA7_9GAMM|nr:hypothetical protein A8L45_04185 [Veronia pacifica]